MLRNLQECSTPVTAVSARVAIVGSGVAGLFLATKLARLGIDVVVLESGAEEGPAHGVDPLNIVEERGQPYRGAIHGRLRGLGGTSRIWGGAMLPFLPCDMEAHTAGWPVDWPVGYSDVSSYFSEIEQIFRLQSGSYLVGDSDETGDASFILRSAKWPAFRLRNVTKALRKEVKEFATHIWLNSTVTGFNFNESGRIKSISAENKNGNRLHVEADLFVLAAGAIESTRLLLLLDAAADQRMFEPDAQLGRYFFDHLSAEVAEVKPYDRSKFNKFFGLKFEHGGIRDLRIEPSPELRREHGLPGAFAHVACIAEETDGLVSLRDIYRSIQSGRSIGWNDVRKLGADFPWLTRAAIWRLAHGRLLYPSETKLKLVLVTEQFPNFCSAITLSHSRRDMFDIPMAVIDWRTSDVDLKCFSALQERLLACWEGGPLAALGRLVPVPSEQWTGVLQGQADVYHPGGTTRMGSSPANGVVDKNLHTFRVPNMMVVSTSCFPSGGGANPTFMLMAFALRAAERIAADLASLPRLASNEAGSPLVLES